MGSRSRASKTRANAPIGVFMAIGSHTPEKPYHFDIIGKDLSQRYGAPFTASAFKKYVIHTAPEEDGVGADANGRIKFKEIVPMARVLKDPKSAAHNAMLKECESKGFKFDPRYGIVASEDSIGGIAKDVAPKFLEKLAQVVNPKLLGNIHDLTVNGTDYVMLTNYGLIKDAAGPYPFHELLRQAAVESGYKNDQRVPMVDQVSLHYMLLSDAEAAPRRTPISATKETFLFAPKGLNQPLDCPANALIQPKHFQCTPEKPDQPINDYFFDHLLANSFRHAILDELAKEVLYKPTSNISPIRNAALEATERRLQTPLFVQITPGIKLTPNKGTVTELHVPRTLEDCVKLLAMEFPPAEGKTALRTADIVIVPPYKPQNDTDHWIMTAMLASYGVARQTDPRYAHSSAIFMNYDGCHDDYLNLMNTLSNHGLNGNFSRQPKLERNQRPNLTKIEERVQLRVDYYNHVLSSEHLENIHSGTHRVARHLVQGMSRSPYMPEAYTQGPHNKPLPIDAPVIVPFLSAANENLHLLMEMQALGAYAAAKGHPVLWGGMTKGGGKILMETYKANGGRHLEAASTGLLAITETSDGRINEQLLDSWYLYSTIAPRAMHLVCGGDILIDAKGGPGTLQETALFLAARALEPEKYGHKPAIFVDYAMHGVSGDLSQKSPVAAKMGYLFGAARSAAMFRSHDALADQGIYFSTSAQETNAFISANVDQVMARRPTLYAAPPSKQVLTA